MSWEWPVRQMNFDRVGVGGEVALCGWGQLNQPGGTLRSGGIVDLLSCI